MCNPASFGSLSVGGITSEGSARAESKMPKATPRISAVEYTMLCSQVKMLANWAGIVLNARNTAKLV